MVSSIRILTGFQFRLLDSLALAVLLLSVLFSGSLLRGLGAFGTLLGLLRGGGTILAICLVSSGVAALLATVEGTSHLFELSKTVSDGLGSAVCASQRLPINFKLEGDATYLAR